MKYNYHKVNPKLVDYVRTALTLEDTTTSKTLNLPLFTNGMPALLCQINKESLEIILFGQSVPNEKWKLDNGTTTVAFFFKPFVVSSIFNISAQTLKDSMNLNQWNPQKMVALRVQLLHSKSVDEKVEILSHFICTQFQANRRVCELIRYATDRLMQYSNTDVLKQLQQELHLTERTFQRMFKKYVGISPNQYRRICQFQFAFLQLKGGHFKKQTDVVYNNEYFDQSHYIRSFKEFTDTTPKEYLHNGLNERAE